MAIPPFSCHRQLVICDHGHALRLLHISPSLFSSQARPQLKKQNPALLPNACTSKQPSSAIRIPTLRHGPKGISQLLFNSPCSDLLNDKLLVLLALNVPDVGGLGVVVVQDFRVPVTGRVSKEVGG